jgi:hypothetical protein
MQFKYFPYPPILSTLEVIARETSQEQWQCIRESAPYRYKPSSAYYARIKRNGKEIRQSLKTRIVCSAKRRLADEQREVPGLRQQFETCVPHKY